MKYIRSFLFLLPILVLTGCGAIGRKDGSMATLYGIAALFSVLILMSYLLLVKSKDRWFTLLLSSIVVVNSGYHMLATSGTLEAALMANRISYLGSAMLPLAMMFIIFNICKINYKKWIPWFFFSIIVGAIIYAILHHKNISYSHAIILAVAVFVNIGVWLTEQLVKIDFEFLSISYIISECFLLMLHLMIIETEKRIEAVKSDIARQGDTSDLFVTNSGESEDSAFTNSQRQFFISQLKTLTPTEKRVYELYVQGKSTKEAERL